MIDVIKKIFLKYCVRIFTYCQFFHFLSSFRNNSQHHQLRINDFHLQMVAESKIDISNKKIHDETSNDVSCGPRNIEKRGQKQHFFSSWHGKCKNQGGRVWVWYRPIDVLVPPFCVVIADMIRLASLRCGSGVNTQNHEEFSS